MLKKRILLLLCIAAALLPCHAKVAEPFPSKFVESVQFEWLSSNRILLKNIKINDSKRGFNLLFDTGSTSCHLTDEVAALLNIEETTKDSVWDGYTNKVQPFGQVDFSIAEINFKQMTTGLAYHSLVEGTQIDGIIGFNLIRQCVWKFDIPNGFIGIANDVRAFDDYKAYYKQRLALIYGEQPYVVCGFERIRGAALFDTGNNTTFTIPQPGFSKRFAHTIKGKGAGYATANAVVLDTAFVAELIQFPFFNFGKTWLFPRWYPLSKRLLKIENRQQCVAQLIADVGSELVVGCGIFNYYNIILDAGRKKIYTKVHNSRSQAFESYGMAAMPYNGKYVVAVVWDKSDAKSAGIRPGDEFLQIANLDLRKLSEKPVSEISPQIDKVFKGDEPIEVTVKSRNGKLVNAVLHKRVLL